MKHILRLFTLATLLLATSAGAEHSLQTRIYRELMRTPPAEVDTESVEARRMRMWSIAVAIANVVRNRQEAVAMITLSEFESQRARYVGEGCLVIPKGAANCDSGKSRSYWQVRKWCKRAWALARGHKDAVNEFAACAVRHWRAAYRRCKGRHPDGDIAGAFSGYRSVQCDWEGATKRAVRYAEIARRL